MPVEPWFAYPPEINAARILGPGPGAWIFAAAQWAIQAAEASSAQAIFQAQTGIQVGNMEGDTSQALAAKAPPFTAWLADMQAEAARNAVEHIEVARSYSTALGTMVPLPVIAANRAQAAAGHAATALGAPNPAGIAADIEYAAFQVHNGATMSAYDTTSQIATHPRTYAPPPSLVEGMGGVVNGSDVLDAISPHAEEAGKAAVESVQQKIASQPSFVQQLQETAAGGPGQFASQQAALSPQAIAGAQQAMMPAQAVMNHMASPGMYGVGQNGLGAAGMGMGAAPGAHAAGSGLPLAGGGAMGAAGGSGSGASVPRGSSSMSGLGGSSGVRAGMSGTPGGLASSASRPNLSALAGLLGSGSGGAPAAPSAPGAGAGGGGMGAGAKGPFSGVSSQAAQTSGAGARGGGMAPMMPGNNSSKKSTSSEMDAEDVVYEDPVAAAAASRRADRSFE